MRILLASANRERVPYPVLPIGLCAVASALEADGHEVEVVDLCFAPDPERALRDAVLRMRPGLVGLGLRNLDNCDFYVPKGFLPEAHRLVRTVRACTDAPVLIGGPAVGILPREVTDFLKPDFAVAGDGEEAAVALARALERGEDPSGIPGLCVPGRDPNPRSLPGRLDALPPPRIHRWVDLAPYARYETPYPLQTKRGCALTCTYCTYVNLEGRRYRFRDGSSVADEVEEVRDRAGVRDFEFVDSTFNAPPHHALEVCRALAARRTGARFIGNGMNPVATTPELLHAMRDAGFVAMVSTAESASDRVLKSLGKGFTRAHLETVAAAARATGMPTLWIFLLGGPGEDRDTVRETLEFIHDATGPRDVAFVTAGVRIYPDTPLERTAREEGFFQERSELLLPRFYLSRDLDRDWLRTTLRAHARRDPRLLSSERSQGRLVPLGLRLLTLLGARKPLWRWAPLLNRVMAAAG